MTSVNLSILRTPVELDCGLRSVQFMEQQEKQQKAKEKKMKGKESFPVHW